MPDARVPQVVIIGGGFGGLKAAEALAKLPVRITIVDRKNHHTFQPLLYQVATAGLSPAEIAAPIRGILGHFRNVEVLMGEVIGIDVASRKVQFHGYDLAYDYLVVAAGATHAYFGHDDWEPLAPGLKTLEDALEMRRRILLAYELAEREALLTGTHLPLNFVVVGGGPTGVELAGTVGEISRMSLGTEYKHIDPSKTRILLVEGGPTVLSSFPPDLQQSALRQLHKLGVEVRVNAMVTDVREGEIRIGDEIVPAAVVLWAAGVSASPLGKALGAPTDRAGRVLVEPDLSIPGHPEVFVVGDLASITYDGGKPVPGLAPAAMQEGKWVGRQIKADLEGKPRAPFRYLDKGTLATIGRAAAVADLPFGIHISGFFAWLSWLFIHIFFLIGFRNRLAVMFEWAWSYLTYARSARLITGESEIVPMHTLQHMEEASEHVAQMEAASGELHSGQSKAVAVPERSRRAG
ncbi:MAG: NAD(P)/FAD-dependent oxidoreductase [Candidatus Korobacteraceae bacterium]